MTPYEEALELLDECRSRLAVISCCRLDAEKAYEDRSAEKASDDIDKFLRKVGYDGSIEDMRKAGQAFIAQMDKS